MQITAIRPFVARFDIRRRVVIKFGTDEGLYVGNAGAGGAGRNAERELSAGRVCGRYAGSPGVNCGRRLVRPGVTPQSRSTIDVSVS